MAYQFKFVAEGLLLHPNVPLAEMYPGESAYLCRARCDDDVDRVVAWGGLEFCGVWRLLWDLVVSVRDCADKMQ